MFIGPLDRRVVIERKFITRDPNFGSETVGWLPIATVWASVMDQPDTKRNGQEVVVVDQRVQVIRTQIRIRYRKGITSDMRIQLPDRERTFQIVGIAEVGRRDALDLICEQYSV